MTNVHIFKRAKRRSGEPMILDRTRGELYQASTTPAVWRPQAHGAAFRAFVQGLALATASVVAAGLIVFWDWFTRLPEGESRVRTVGAIAFVVGGLLTWAWRQS